MPFIDFMSHFELLCKDLSTSWVQFSIAQVKWDQSWNHISDEFWGLPTKVVVGKIEDLQVKSCIVLVDKTEFLQAFRRDAAVRQIELLQQGGSPWCSHCLQNSRDAFIVDPIAILDSQVVSQIQTCQRLVLVH